MSATKTAVKCQAQDPATCRYHKKLAGKNTVIKQLAGKSSVVKKKVEVPVQDKSEVEEDMPTFDAFEAALRKKDSFRRIEAQMFYKKNYVKELREKQLEANVPVTDIREGLTDYSNPENVRVLQEYNAEYHRVSAGWSNAQKEAVNEYTGLSNQPINHLLRDRDNYIAMLKPESRERIVTGVEKLVSDLDSVFASAPEREESRSVYRVVEQDMTKEFMSSEAFADKLGVGSVGDVVEFKSFLSTSIDPHFTARWVSEEEENTAVVFVMNSRKGVPVDTTATHLDEHTYTQKSEREILLPRGLKFRVTGVSRSVGFPERKDDIRSGHMVAPLTVFLDEVTE